MTNLVIKGAPKDYVIERVSYADFFSRETLSFHYSATEDYILRVLLSARIIKDFDCLKT